jgi:hypothetical protein
VFVLLLLLFHYIRDQKFYMCYFITLIKSKCLSKKKGSEQKVNEMQGSVKKRSHRKAQFHELITAMHCLSGNTGY